ncbi:MAG: hypothetical protein HPY82_01615 [Gammaproteobacteria bacterium]|nr:hypothetical protein [Gammaproteobacteria bacterium]
MFHWGRSTALAGLCVFLAACGGGGGGGDKEPEQRAPEPPTYALTQLQNTYEGYRRQSYGGVTTAADLTATNIGPFATLVAELTGNDNALQRSPSMLAVTAVSRASSRGMLAASVTDEGQGSGKSARISRLTVNETADCIYGGSMSLSGQLAENGTGGLGVVYHSCNQDGAVTLDGSGAMYFHDPEATHYTLFYNGLTIQAGAFSQTLTGSVEIEESLFDDEMQIQIQRETHNVLLQSGSQRYMSENLVLKQGQYYEHQTVRGKLYLPTLGFVDVDTREKCINSQNQFLPAIGELSLRGGPGNAQIHYDYSHPRLHLDLNDDDVFDLGANLASDPQTGAVSISALVAMNDLNSPPDIGTIDFAESNVNTTSAITVWGTNTYDYDGDAVTLSFEWRLNGQAPLIHSDRTLPPGVAQKGDRVTVAAVADDGQEKARSPAISLVVGDAPGWLEWQELADNVTSGETARIVARYLDADAIDLNVSSRPFKLDYGPAGMQVATDGTLVWKADDLLFGVPQIYNFSISIAGNSAPPLTGSIQVQDPSAMLPLARSGHDSPEFNRSLWVGDYDAEPGNEILLADESGRVMLLQEIAGDYRQKWLYPFTFGDAFEIRAVLPVDQDGNGRDEPLVLASGGLYLISDLNRLAEEKYRSGEREYLLAAAAANLDNDPGIEVAVLVSYLGNSYDSVSEMRVIDLDTGMVLWTTPVTWGNRALEIGNVDGDANPEIVLSDGSVYDALTHVEEWNNSSPFGDYLALADVNADGVLEIIGARHESHAALYDARTKSALWVLEGVHVCSLGAGNVDADSQDELLVGDCQWGSISVVDGRSGHPVTQWSTSTINHGSVSLTSGDADNDGDVEVLWGSGVTSSGAEIIVVANPGNSSLWYNANPAQLDYFVAAGWGAISPENHAAVFVSAWSNGDHGGQRIIVLDALGNLDIGDQISTNAGKTRYAHLTDYDKDGLSELFMGSAADYNGYFQVRQVLDDVVEWSTSASASSTVGIVTAARLNDDEYEDALYLDGNRVIATDIANQALLWTSPLLGRIEDVTAASLGGPDHDIVIAEGGQLSIWSKNGSGYARQRSVMRQCTRVLAVNVTADARQEIVCANFDFSYGLNGYTSYIAVYDASLLQLAAFQVPGWIVDLAPAPGSSPGQILVAFHHIDQEGLGRLNGSAIALVSLTQQAVVWTSPEFPGAMQSHSLHPFTDEAGKSRLTFATQFAMFMTR